MMPTIRGIARDALRFILEASKNSHPNEFAGLLEREGDAIAYVVLLPGTILSHENALMKLNMVPLGTRVVGSTHSHPTPSKMPSSVDLMLFARVGNYHIITCYPYEENDWACYDKNGNYRELEVLGE